MAALRTHVENGHGFIGRTNLDSLEVGQIVFACLSICAQNTRPVDILPGIFAAEHVVHFFALESDSVFELLVDSEHVWASLAEKAEVSDGLLSEEDVGASGAEKHLTICRL